MCGHLSTFDPECSFVIWCFLICMFNLRKSNLIYTGQSRSMLVGLLRAINSLLSASRGRPKARSKSDNGFIWLLPMLYSVTNK